MKRIYIKPQTDCVTYYGDVVMDSSSDSARNVGGGPTEEGIPTVVGETGDDTDPYGGHGQGTGGGGNRGKEFDLWDIDSFDVWN